MKTALAHDWLNGMRGGEKCLEELLKLYPQSSIYTLLYEKGKLSDRIEARPIKTSFMQKFPFMRRKYKQLLPLLPLAAASVKVDEADMMISTNHCVAKSFKKPAGAKAHICYCFTPMRYAWLFFDEYFGSFPLIMQWLIKPVLALLRIWDKRTAKNVTHFIGISNAIKKRIETFYNRKADMIYPPVDTDFYTPAADTQREEYYLVVSALVPYKRVDLAVLAAKKMDKKLIVIGTGPQSDYLKEIAGPKTEFLGWQTDEVIRDHYRRASALLFPGEEDFGIVPIEAQACGLPVAAYKAGGALETIQEGKTGVFFDVQTTESLADCLQKLETAVFHTEAMRQWALTFSQQRFRDEISRYVDKVMNQDKEPVA